MKPIDIILEALAATRGSRLLDIGCGSGALGSRLVARDVAWTGIDPQGGTGIIEAQAEALPFDDAAFDLVLFQNSLHHIPEAGMIPALTEAARVLAPGGYVLIIEPDAEGALAAAMAPLDDETAVRQAAQQAIAAATAAGAALRLIRQECEMRHEVYADFDAFVASMIAVDPDRAARAQACADALRVAFEANATRVADGWQLTQPMHVHLLAPF